MTRHALNLVAPKGRPSTLKQDSTGEWELIYGARTSPESFAILYRRYYPAILRYVRHRVGDEHLARDLVAETFMTALENLHSYRDRGLPFCSWLYRLATSRISRWARRRRIPLTVEFDELAHCKSERVDRSQALNDLTRQALLDLPLRYQDALALHYLEGLSVREVAQTLKVREGTIKARLFRGRERLRLKLAPYAGDWLS